MSDFTSRLQSMNRNDISRRIQAAGVAGAGGAGFPSYAKWSAIGNVDYLLVNHQESEPNFYADKWLGKEHAEDLAAFATAVTGKLFDCVVVGTKNKYRDEWLSQLENTLDATFYEPDSLPLDIEEESGTAIAATPDMYTYSEESVLLMVTAGVSIGDDLPTDHGWLVHNTETLYNIFQALSDGTPVTRKYVHVGGETPRHRCLEVPIGTPAAVLLESAGIDSGEVSSGQMLADGGPGWCYGVELPPQEFGIRKRTNGILVLEEELATEHTEDDGQIDVLTAGDWTDRPHETEPCSLSPNEVRIPLITNAAYEGLVAPSEPVVNSGDKVAEGDVIAAPAGEEISNTQHASIDGIIADITDTHVIIERA